MTWRSIFQNLLLWAVLVVGAIAGALWLLDWIQRT
jgi:hypothetical protein